MRADRPGPARRPRRPPRGRAAAAASRRRGRPAARPGRSIASAPRACRSTPPEPISRRHVAQVLAGRSPRARRRGVPAQRDRRRQRGDRQVLGAFHRAWTAGSPCPRRAARPPRASPSGTAIFSGNGRLDHAGRAPAHPQVALDGAAAPQRAGHLGARAGGLFRVGGQHRVHVGGRAADVDHDQVAAEVVGEQFDRR